MDKNQVAQTIVQQLGAWRFVVMTGAKLFSVLSEGGVQFSLPSNSALQSINRVSIVLTPADLYDITFSRVRGVEVKEVAKYRGIFFDQLQLLFTSVTGLATRL